jgi:hypothetical protein
MQIIYIKLRLQWSCGKILGLFGGFFVLSDQISVVSIAPVKLDIIGLRVPTSHDGLNPMSLLVIHPKNALTTLGTRNVIGL